MSFIGRSQEKFILNQAIKKPIANFIVVYGRRRIGKSSLIEEFCSDFDTLFFEGLSPRKGQTQQDQLNEFHRQLSRQSQDNHDLFADWSDAFYALSQCAKKGRKAIVLDEISWMAMEDRDFAGKLKIAWDKYFKKNSKLILFVCGSVSAWIKDNFVVSKAFHGRVSVSLCLRELPINLCKQFWGQQSNKISISEILKILSITGGIPKYLEEIHPKLTAEENIRQLAFSESGILFNDFKEIFTDTLIRKSPLYEKIIRLLSEASYDSPTLSKKLDMPGGSYLSEILEELSIAGFISRHPLWNFNTGKESKTYLYRLSDNYLRFYLKYIEPNAGKIISGNFKERSLSSLPGWSSIMGLQIENLILSNRQIIKKLLHIKEDEIICDNPYLQRQTQRKKGCQIDYLIQTKFNNFYVCEIKFTQTILRSYVIDEIKEKIEKLKIPKNSSVRPVLIHFGDIHDEVLDADYFAAVIDMKQLFQ